MHVLSLALLHPQHQCYATRAFLTQDILDLQQI